MKLAIIIFALSTLLFFIKIKLDFIDMYNGVYKFWQIIKTISFLLMIGSFIAIIIML